MESIWSDTVNISPHKPLWHNIRTEVLVIGGGLAGILCAHSFSTQKYGTGIYGYIIDSCAIDLSPPQRIYLTLAIHEKISF